MDVPVADRIWGNHLGYNDKGFQVTPCVNYTPNIIWLKSLGDQKQHKTHSVKNWPRKWCEAFFTECVFCCKFRKEI